MRCSHCTASLYGICRMHEIDVDNWFGFAAALERKAARKPYWRS